MTDAHCPAMRSDLWNIVLAAGAGRRLAGLTGGIPKQFWSADDGPTLLDDTLSRTAPLAPPDHTVIVVDETHASFVRTSSRLEGFAHLRFQPCDRGTAAGVLFGLLPAVSAHRDSIVMLSPSDHGIAMPRLLTDEVRQVVRSVQADEHDVVLFGVVPDAAVGDYGWITHSGSALSSSPRRVTGFVEKPPPDLARELFETGGVWNTMIMVARASTLWELYRRHLPEVTTMFDAALSIDDAGRDEFLRTSYPRIPVADFSRDLLESATGLALHILPATLGWSDLGTPERLHRWHSSHGRQLTSSGRSPVAARNLRQAS